MVNLNGGNQKVGGAVYEKFVGLGPVTLVAANPTKEELETLLGTTLERSPDYSPKANDKGVNVKPIIMWFRLENGSLVSAYFNIANSPVASNDGTKFKFINSVGQVSYYAPTAEDIKNNPKVAKWYKGEGMRKINIGEEELYDLLQGFTRYNASAEGANWMEVMNSLGITAEGLMSSVKGLNEFIEYINTNGNRLVMSHVVNVSEDDEGRRRERQQLLTDKNTYFRTEDGTVNDYMVSRLAKYSSEKIAEGYAMTTKEYFIGPLRPYNSNDVPVAPGPMGDSPGAEPSGLLDL